MPQFHSLKSILRALLCSKVILNFLKILFIYKLSIFILDSDMHARTMIATMHFGNGRRIINEGTEVVVCIQEEIFK